MRSILEWLREVLTGVTTKPKPPWTPPSLDDGDHRFPPLDDNDSQPGDPDPSLTPQHYILYPIRPAHEINALLDPAVPGNLWESVGGHDQAKRHLSQIAGHALRREDHQCEANLILAGSNAADRTAIARGFASTILTIPFVPFDATVLAKAKKPTSTILFEIANTLMKWSEAWVARGGVDEDGLGMTLTEIDTKFFYPPPLVVFIDEAEKLSETVNDALLKATDSTDRMIVTEMGNTVRCERICWILGVRDRGMLPAAFVTRLEKVDLA